MHSDTGTIYTDAELQAYFTTHTTEEIREFEKKVVYVSGEKEAIAELSAKVATSKDNILRLHAEARQRAYRKLK